MAVVACTDRRGSAKAAADKWATITRERRVSSDEEEEERIVVSVEEEEEEEAVGRLDSRETRARSKLAINSG